MRRVPSALALISVFSLHASPSPGDEKEPYVHNYVKTWAHPFLEHLVNGRVEQAYKETTTAQFRGTISLDDFQKTIAAFDLKNAESHRWVDHHRTARFGREFIHAKAEILFPGKVYLTLHAYGVPKPGTSDKWGEGYLLESFKFERQLGEFTEYLFAPPEADCEKLARDSLALLADAQKTGDFTRFRAAGSLALQEESPETLKKTYANAFGPHDTSFLTGGDLDFYRPEIGAFDLLEIDSGTVRSAKAFRELGFEAKYTWEDGAWKLVRLAVSLAHYLPEPLEDPPSKADALTLAKETLDAWKTAVLKDKIGEFAQGRSSTFLLEAAGGSNAFEKAFAHYKNPELKVAALDVDSAQIDKPEAFRKKILIVKGVAPMGERTLRFHFEFYPEDTWKFSHIQIDHIDKKAP